MFVEADYKQTNVRNDNPGEEDVPLLGEGAGYWQRLSDLLASSRAAGPLVHDARVAALCLANGVSELWTADRDFGRFPSLKVRNPLVSR